jgi:hypothetical protein
MKIVTFTRLIDRGTFSHTEESQKVIDVIAASVKKVAWPPGSNSFAINPDRGRKQGQGNGVKPREKD